MSDDKKDKIGYKNPPKNTQFKKGQSGNPGGRPKKSQNVQSLVKKEMAEIISVEENGMTKELSKAQVLVKGLFAQALQQDHKAIRTLWPLLQQIGVLDQQLEQQTEIDHMQPSDLDILKRFIPHLEAKEENHNEA